MNINHGLWKSIGRLSLLYFMIGFSFAAGFYFATEMYYFIIANWPYPVG